MGASSPCCLALDAVGTVLYPHPPAAAVYHEVGRRYGATLALEETAERLRRAFQQQEAIDLAGTLTTNEQREYQRWRTIVHQVFRELDEPVREQCFEVLFAHFARPDAWRIYDDAQLLLAGAEQRAVPVVLASNFDARLRRICDGLGLLRLLTGCVISSEVGFRKPHRRFFDAVVQACGCERPEVLYVGDSYVNDFQGATQAGLAAVLVDRRTQRSRSLPPAKPLQLPTGGSAPDCLDQTGLTGSRSRGPTPPASQRMFGVKGQPEPPTVRSLTALLECLH